jgi:hypothetical protein
MRRRLAAALLALLVLTACEHKELCYDHHHYQTVEVHFDWSQAPDASPAGMVLYFYDMEGALNVQRFDLSGRDGGQIGVTPGRYTVLFYNNDTEFTLFRGTATFEEHQAYTAEQSMSNAFSRNEEEFPRAYAANERVLSCPDMIWGCTATDVKVDEKGVTVLTFSPHELVAVYSYEIRNVVNVTALEYFGGLLSGMANSITLSSESTRSEVATVPFVSDHVEDNTLLGEFYTFGAASDEDAKNILTLYVWMRDGQRWYYNFDVTDQVATADDPMHVHLVIDGLELPLPLNDSGYSAGVDDWQTDNVDVEI